MLELKGIKKSYNKQLVLKNINIKFNESGFVSILGPSGSGKTTILNIIGGLDRYDEGDLIINGISTKNYKERDWDNYRNHRIGFVFQDYNLISHLNVYQNVKLSLTLSGISKKESDLKVKKILKSVGLENYMFKMPNQLSGGQMQRVAIARALVNNPDIILADEATGALDSHTSKQIMNLLKEISKTKLVIMVTHNKELANSYSNRIIVLKDGEITNDKIIKNKEYKNISNENNFRKNKKMNLLTALTLSLKNLINKKGRTLLVSLAGSIGIIGIALVLSLSNGLQKYIDNIQKETLNNYPITIGNSNITTFLDDIKGTDKCSENKICFYNDNTNYHEINMTNLKKFVDKNLENKVNYIEYIYDVNLNIYTKKNNKYVKIDEDIYKPIIGKDEIFNNQYELIEGRYPEQYDELILIVDENNKLPLSIYSLLFEDTNEIDYNQIINKTYKLLLNIDYYKKENNVWIDMHNDTNYINNLISNGIDLKIVGIYKLKDTNINTSTAYIGYNNKIIDYIIDKNNNSDMIKQQLNNKDIDILTGYPFYQLTYLDNLNKFGYIDTYNPSIINIYPKDLNSKNDIKNMIEEYNTNNDEFITYIDVMDVLLSSVTSIIKIVSYILICFIAISLIVSSIMISIVTYISVLERTKEIGILRSLGSSQKDIQRVFYAETMIEGFVAGLLGVLITYSINFIINIIIRRYFIIDKISELSISTSIILVLISIFITVIAGYIPSRIASNKKPVDALKSS